MKKFWEVVLGGREKLKKKLKFVLSFVIFLDLLINKNESISSFLNWFESVISLISYKKIK